MTRVLVIDEEAEDRLGAEFDRVFAPIGGCQLADGRTLGRSAYVAHYAQWEKPTIQIGAERAEELGHVLEADPPWGLTRTRRLTCIECGSAVLAYPGNNVPYGSAYERVCPSLFDTTEGHP